jgi:hypothetical protein
LNRPLHPVSPFRIALLSLLIPFLFLYPAPQAAPASEGKAGPGTAASPVDDSTETVPDLQPQGTGAAPATDFPPYGIRQWEFDTGYLLTRPKHWNRRSWYRVSGVAGTTVALYLLRDEIREVVQRNRNDSRTDFFSDVRNMGKGGFAPSLALVAWLSSFATRNEREKETALLLMESWAYSAAYAWAGSFVLAAERPEDGDSVTFFDTDGHGVSLDAALAASVIRPLHRQYLRVKPGDGGGRKFWKRTALGLLYAGAGLTAYQRLYQDQHWAPDVFLGTWTGLTVGKNLNRAHDQIAGGRAQGRHRIEPAGNMLRWTIDLSHRRSPHR